MLQIVLNQTGKAVHAQSATDSSVIILSYSQPSFPKYCQRDMLVDLPITTPIFVNVHGLPMEGNTPENMHKLHAYAKALSHQGMPFSHASIGDGCTYLYWEFGACYETPQTYQQVTPLRTVAWP
jgi:hypothetical protein